MSVYCEINNDSENFKSLNLNINEFSEAEAKDEILKFCIKFPKERITTNTIIKKVFPNSSREKINYLLKEIAVFLGADKFTLKFNTTSSTSFITTNELTKEFLNTSSFTKIEIENLKKLRKEEEKATIEFRKTKIDLELAEKMLEEFPKTKWFARIGFIIGVVLMLKELYILLWK